MNTSTASDRQLVEEFYDFINYPSANNYECLVNRMQRFQADHTDSAGNLVSLPTYEVRVTKTVTKVTELFCE